jgi:UDP-N-acetylmuramoyl-L-alanyl-D-glutamate--2,6-diaminopimelate ligase
MTDSLGTEILEKSDSFFGIPILRVSDPRAYLGEVCKLVYGDPAAGITLIGVTGTNGKSTTTSMIYQAARAAGVRAGLVGTLATVINGEEIGSVRTTPEAPDLFQILVRMKAAGVKLIAMEISSIALSEHRINGLTFECVGFTNLSHDHLDYHGSMNEYFAAKAELFTAECARSAVICTDSLWGHKLCESITIPFETLGVVGTPGWKLLPGPDTASWLLRGPREEVQLDSLAMPGTINALNAALALAILDRVGIRGNVVNEAVSIATVAGRGELVAKIADVCVYVDYAHSPESIREFLTGLKREHGGRIIIVLGAGGDRDASKRGEMGRVGALLSDIFIVTDDNPRSENPAQIRGQLMAGAAGIPDSHVIEIGDRRDAIARALHLAGDRDVIAILGKGHERGQEISGRTIEFSDVDVVAELRQSVVTHD